MTHSKRQSEGSGLQQSTDRQGPVSEAAVAFQPEIRTSRVPTLAGRSHFTFAGTTHTCRIEVHWLFERYFKFDGVSADPRGCMFNTCYFQINPAGDRIHGRYIGFGPHTNGIIVGEASGAKVGKETR